MGTPPCCSPYLEVVDPPSEFRLGPARLREVRNSRSEEMWRRATARRYAWGFGVSQR